MRQQIRSLVLILLALAFAFGIYKYYDEDELPLSPGSVDQNLQAHDVTINVFNPLGRLTFKVFTEELSVFNQKDFTFQQVLAYRNPNDGSSPFLLKSDKAYYSSKIVKFLANNQVFPIQGSFNGFQEANFEQADFDTRTMILNSQEAIKIIGENYASQAQGFTFNFKTDSYELRNAHTQYQLPSNTVPEALEASASIVKAESENSASTASNSQASTSAATAAKQALPAVAKTSANASSETSPQAKASKEDSATSPAVSSSSEKGSKAE